ncbi:MAG: Nramp family divalent metal transporter [Bacteroidia bacterium]
MSNQHTSLSEVNSSVNIPKKKGWFKTLLAFIGPAYLVSVGYMDPGNWATDIAGGSRFGYSLIWVLLMSNLMALLLQSLSARLGIVKGWDLAQASRQQYPNWVNYSLYVFAEIAIAATDLAEIIGMAIGLSLLFKLPMLYGVLITVFDTFLLLFLLNRGIRVLEAFILVLISIIGVSFLIEMFIVKPEVAEVAKGFIPQSLTGEALYIAIGIIGATVMPHNLYLHSSLVQTRRFEKTTEGIKKAIKFNLIDSAIALNSAFFVNAAILILAASAFYNRGFYEVSDISDAHKLLQNLFGNLAPALFAIALISAGQSSTITGTLAGQIVMEGYLNLRISPWLRRLITRLIAVVPALFTIVYFGEKMLGELLILSQVILSIQLGFAVVPLIYFTSNKKIMGQFAISLKTQIAAWVIAAIIIALNLKLVYEEILGFWQNNPNSFWLYPIVTVTAYSLFLLVYIIVNPVIFQLKQKQIIPHKELNINLKFNEPLHYKHIGIAVDFSKYDNDAIKHAIKIGADNATYFLIHIVESATAIKYGDEVQDEESKKDESNLIDYKNMLQLLGFKAEYCLGYGRRSKQLAEIVKQQNIDFLVMAAHGHKGLKDFIFGSTVDEVRHIVNIPVLVVKS